MSFTVTDDNDRNDYNVTIKSDSWKYPQVAGSYDAVIEDVKKFDGKYGETVLITYSIVKDNESYLVPDYMRFYDTLRAGTKLHSRLLGILGEDIEDMKTFNLLDLIGRAVVVVIDFQMINDHKDMRVVDVRGH